MGIYDGKYDEGQYDYARYNSISLTITSNGHIRISPLNNLNSNYTIFATVSKQINSAAKVHRVGCYYDGKYDSGRYDFATYDQGAADINENYYIFKTSTKTLNSNSYVKVIDNTNSLNGNAHIKLIPSKTLNSNSFIFKTGTSTINSNSFVTDTYTKTINSQASIKKEGQEGSRTADYYIKHLAYTKTINSNSYIKKVDNTKTITQDGFIIYLRTYTISSNSIIKTTYAKTLNSNSFVKVLDNTKTVNSNGHIENIISKTIISNAYIMETSEGGFTSNMGITRISRVELVSPANGTISTDYPAIFTWKIPSTMIDKPMHFEIQVATDAAFTNLLSDLSSINDTTFTYWNGSSWVAVPYNGVPTAYYGNNARISIALARGWKYWRVRGLIK